MQSGGVVRDIQSWGTLVLPQRMKRLGGKDQPYHAIGEYVPCFLSVEERGLKANGGLVVQLLDVILRGFTTEP